MNDLIPMITGGKLKLIVDRIMPMSEAGSAHQHLASRGTRGKVILHAMNDATERYAAVYDAAVGVQPVVDHQTPGDHWAEMAKCSASILAGPKTPTCRSWPLTLSPRRTAGRWAAARAEFPSRWPTAYRRLCWSNLRRVCESSSSLRGTRPESQHPYRYRLVDGFRRNRDVIHLSDVTYFVRDIVPFVEKLHNSASRRVMITVWRPNARRHGSELRSAVLGDGLPIGRDCGAGAVLWEWDCCLRFVVA